MFRVQITSKFNFFFLTSIFMFFMQSTCRKMKKIPDTVWMTMIQQYNKNSGKDGKQGMQVRNEFQSQACPWPSTHSDRVCVGGGPPITRWIVKGNAAKCWHWTVFPFQYNKCWKHGKGVITIWFFHGVWIPLENLDTNSWKQSLQRKTWKWIN